MEKLIIEGRGGADLDVQEILSDEMIGVVEGFSTELGRAGKDPYYAEMANFRNEISNMHLITIDSSHVTSGKFDNLAGDLSGNDEDIMELKDRDFITKFDLAPDLEVSKFASELLAVGFGATEREVVEYLTEVDPFMEDRLEDGYYMARGSISPFGLEFDAPPVKKSKPSK